MTCTRPYLLAQLRILLDYSMQRIQTRQTAAKAKPRWARIAVSAASAAASILRDDDLEDIHQRIQHIEEKLS
jgi:hypothetical protein